MKKILVLSLLCAFDFSGGTCNATAEGIPPRADVASNIDKEVEHCKIILMGLRFCTLNFHASVPTHVYDLIHAPMKEVASNYETLLRGPQQAYETARDNAIDYADKFVVDINRLASETVKSLDNARNQKALDIAKTNAESVINQMQREYNAASDYIMDQYAHCRHVARSVQTHVNKAGGVENFFWEVTYAWQAELGRAQWKVYYLHHKLADDIQEILDAREWENTINERLDVFSMTFTHAQEQMEELERQYLVQSNDSEEIELGRISKDYQAAVDAIYDALCRAEDQHSYYFFD